MSRRFGPKAKRPPECAYSLSPYTVSSPSARATTSAARRTIMSALPADAGRLVDARVFAEVRHHLFGEELHHLERLLVARAGHPRAENPGLDPVGEDPQLVGHRVLAAARQLTRAS